MSSWRVCYSIGRNPEGTERLDGDDVTDATAPETKKLGLKLVLTGLVLATVLLTALFIHLLWANAARRNVADVVAQLNQEIIDRVKNEVRGVLDDAVAAQNAVGSVFANGTITLNEESKRDFIFLALLRSKPSLSWISLGTDDGSFFGAQRELVAQSDGDHLKLVTVALDPTSNARSEHSFSFEAKGNDIQYVSKEDPRPSGYDATRQAWYRRALAEGPGWNDDPDVPQVARAGISTSTPLDINSKRVGVINVVIELERLSSFLQRLQVGKSGTVVIIDRDGHVVASADETAIAQQRLGQMPMLGELGATNPLLALADDMIDSKKVNLQSVGDPRQFEIISPKDGTLVLRDVRRLEIRRLDRGDRGTRQRLPHQHRRKCPLSAGGAGGADAGDGRALGHAHQSPGRAAADPHRRAAQAYRGLPARSGGPHPLAAARVRRPLDGAPADESRPRLVPEIHADRAGSRRWYRGASRPSRAASSRL